ncbi:uncharacterized protein LOC128951843 [Oppia nitens]|uniref:uncharacterized protein LOC128951843 n=1 Tax=Oppia nitens TaxID=1686743 RepID=UPI0023DA46B4|nr:uncharacterized protein LOC128951843 [Oppia nitens]
MFVSLVFVLCFTSAFSKNLLSNDVLIEKLQLASLQVIEQHSSDSLNDDNYQYLTQEDILEDNVVRSRRSVPRIFKIPVLENTTDFMHSYVADTGVGNREDIIVENIQEEQLKVLVPSSMLGWKYLRFNSTDYVMAFQDFNINVWQMTLTGDIRGRGLMFDSRNAYCSVNFYNEGQVIDAMFYTKVIKYSEVLMIALTIGLRNGYQLRIYEVVYGECVSVLQQNLQHNRPLRMSLIRSQYESALVLLYNNTRSITDIKYSQKTHDESTKLIEVFTDNAIDLETMSINGFTFLIIANGKGCQVYKMNEFLTKHYISENIAIPEIIDIKPFRLGFNHFLGLATKSIHQYLYIWDSNSFYLKQIFKANNVLKLNTIYMATCRDDVLIYFTRQGFQELIYRWDGQRRHFQLVNNEMITGLSRGYQVLTISAADFSYNHTAYIFIVDSNRRPHLVSISTKLDVVPDPELMRGHKIYELMNNLKERFIFEQTYLQKMSDELKYAIRSTSNEHIVSQSFIHNLNVLKGINANNINTLSKIVWQNSKLSINDLKFKIKDMKIVFNIIEQNIQKLLYMTNDVVLRNRPTLITGHKLFIGLNEIKYMNTTSASIGLVGQQNLKHLFNNLFRKSKLQVIRGIKRMIKPIVVNKFLNSGSINGIDLRRQMVTTNTHQLINSSIVYNSQLTIANNLHIKDKLNGLDVNRDLIYLNRPEVIFTPKVFTSHLTIANIVNTLTIDGINVKQLAQNTLLSNGLPQIMSSNLKFVKPLTTKSISVVGLVNNVDISTMVKYLVYKNHPIQVKGKKIFNLDDLKMKNNLFVIKTFDGLSIPNDILLKNKNQIISGEKYFIGLTRFVSKVSAIGLVDGLRLPQDIVTLTRNDTIKGPIDFANSIVVNQHIIARRLVDGVDISELYLLALKSSDSLIQNNVRFFNSVTVDAIELTGYVNGINLNYLFNEAIFKGNPKVQISGTKIFEATVIIKQLLVDRINGVVLSNIMTTNKNETILMPKIFVSETTFNSIDTNGFVAGVHMRQLYDNRISLTKSETIPQLKHFVNQIIITGNLTVGSINGLVPQKDFVLKSRPQHINGPKVFAKTLNANKVFVGKSTFVTRKVDNIIIQNLNSRAIRLNVDQTLPQSLILINCNASFVEIFKDVNGLNINDFANNVMSLTRPQVVVAPKHFKAIQTFQRIESSRGISGVSLAYLKANAVVLNGVSRIRAPFTFAHTVIINNPIFINGVINGVNIGYLANDAVYKNIKNMITGRNVFRSGFEVSGDIHTTKFNGIDLSNELFTKTRDHVIKGKVKFVKSVNVNEDIAVGGRVNGIKLSEFNARVIKSNTQTVIKGNLELIGTINVMSSLNSAGHINGINLKQVFNDAVYLNTNQDIVGTKRITEPIYMFGHLNSSHLNSVPVIQFLTDVVLINNIKEEHIIAPKIFVNDVEARGLVQSKGIAQMGPINGVNIVQLKAESVMTNRATVLPLNRRFIDNVIIANMIRIDGKINGIDLWRDVILLNVINNREPQVITGNKAFEQLVLNDNAVIKGLVNGYPLKSLEINTVYTSNNQRITGHKIFKGLVHLFSPNNRVEVLNGLRIPEDWITLNGKQQLNSNLVFNSPLNIKNNLFVTGNISGHNLTRLATRSLRKDRPQEIIYPIRFDTLVFRQDVMVDQHVDNIDLSALSNTVKQFTRVVNVSKDVLIDNANRHHYISDYIYKSLEKSVFEIDSFVLYQFLDEVHGNSIEIVSNNAFTISDSMGNPSAVHLVKYNIDNELFEATLINQNKGLITKTFALRGHEFIVHLNPYVYNYTSHLTASGKLLAPIGQYITSMEVLTVSKTMAILISYQSNTGKLIVDSLEVQSNKYIFNRITESIVGRDTSKVIAFLRQSVVHIVVGKHRGMNCILDSTGTLIFVLKYHRTLELIQSLSVINVVDIIYFENNRKYYLALSEGTSGDGSIGSHIIHIYRNDYISDYRQHKCSFSLFQRLYFNNAIQLSTFTFGTVYSHHQYLTAFNSSNVIVWKLKGESGFTDNWILEAKSAKVLVPAVFADKLYLIVGQSYKCHESLIFKAETRGISLAPIVFSTK